MKKDIEKEFYKSIGKKIKIARKSVKINQMQMSNLLGLSRASISNIETGKQAVSVLTLFKISKITGYPINSFFHSHGWNINIDNHKHEVNPELIKKIKTINRLSEKIIKDLP